MFRKILIANRGEIAVRIIRTCRAMGIRSAVVFSDVDRSSLAVRLADEAVHIGPATPAESYLAIERIIDAAHQVRAAAIHPGYGFLSENPLFAEACARADLKFIGPSSAAMKLMASKTDARETMRRAGVPVVPGTTQPVQSQEVALEKATEIGFPVMLKAAGGGGGKGMRLVGSESELPSALQQARHEALRAFGNQEVYLERAFTSPHHVEVQILADEWGNVIHLGERECSLQRRHQKILEESPSPLVERLGNVREQLTAAAVEAATAAGYTNAGTVEFLMDGQGRFYFLEMNARLQVEHPVTELRTGLDLVREQILVAAGNKLPYRQDDIQPHGAAVECRIYAEDPDNDFFPSPGRITSLSEPSGPRVRVDSGAYAGWSVPIEYDPLIAKLVVWGANRPQAIDRLRAALREYYIGGIQTTIGLFRELVLDEEFRVGACDTAFLPRWLARRAGRVGSLQDPEQQAALLAAGRHFLKSPVSLAAPSPARGSAWKRAGKQAILRGL